MGKQGDHSGRTGKQVALSHSLADGGSETQVLGEGGPTPSSAEEGALNSGWRVLGTDLSEPWRIIGPLRASVRSSVAHLSLDFSNNSMGHQNLVNSA